MVEPVEALRLSDWVIAGCTLLGPVLAVQAQKWVEGFREKKARRLKSLPIEITGAPGATSLQTILAEKTGQGLQRGWIAEGQRHQWPDQLKIKDG